jgi:hypothetical protein
MWCLVDEVARLARLQDHVHLDARGGGLQLFQPAS